MARKENNPDDALSPDYFYSPVETVQDFIDKKERIISNAQRDIRNSESEIERIKDEI